MSHLQLDYIALEALDAWAEGLERSPATRQILGMAVFGAAEVINGSALPARLAEAGWPRVALPVLGDDTAAWVEVWSVPGNAPKVVHGEVAGVAYAQCADLVFAWLATPLPTQDKLLEQATQQAYDAVFGALGQLGCPHPLRFWNYLPDILGAGQGEERYRIFNVGRHASFLAHSTMVDPNPPAACALGHPEGVGGPLTVYALASSRPAQPIENPRQLSAYRYPPQYGLRSPTFSRAALAPAGDEECVFISGTASIVGHETVHLNDVQAQTHETLNNIEALIDRFRAERPGKVWQASKLQLKAYVRHATDLPQVRQVVEQRLGTDVPCFYLQAVVCRPDLLVEIEATTARSH
ncbi:hypothetical protein [Aquabacterium sp.]|uniref:chorismate transformation enzyme, FkbO/Hyg5 family n=1 Tax=Aquabacterium sp. TaxID=1872578 RepID=UPI002489860B|nr:hypothetical protein [Aquabacterium sp.]MDI1258429.1 hypothetical protein [Aquabacterium sp.]